MEGIRFTPYLYVTVRQKYYRLEKKTRQNSELLVPIQSAQFHENINFERVTLAKETPDLGLLL